MRDRADSATAGARTVRAALAATTAGLVAFFACLVAVEAGTRLAPLDATVRRASLDAMGALPDALVRTVTDLGAAPTTTGLVALGAVALVALGRPRAAVALVLGLTAIFVTVQLVKSGVARERPPGHDPSLVTASYPSGHAAYSTAWTAVALALSSAWRRGREVGRARVPVLVIAVLMTVAIGATRTLLSAHYLSDVVGGWGLGVALFGLAAVFTLGVGTMRQTSSSSVEAPAPERSRSRA
jgi:membrane-associated phospholipid phosphatase